MKHLIVLPYFSRREIEIFSDIADLWTAVTRTDISYEFLLSSRYDCRPSRRLEEKYSRIAPARSMRGITPAAGLFEPQPGFSAVGSSAMFWDTMEFIKRNYESDGGFVFWFEADMVPLVPDWLDILTREWITGRYLVMGKFIDRLWVEKHNPSWLSRMNEHINGGGCYSKDFCQWISRTRCNIKNPWDYEVFPHIQQNFPRMWKAVECIDFRYQQKSLNAPPDPAAVLLHGVKDGSARSFVKRKFECETVKNRKFRRVRNFFKKFKTVHADSH